MAMDRIDTYTKNNANQIIAQANRRI